MVFTTVPHHVRTEDNDGEPHEEVATATDAVSLGITLAIAQIESN